MDPCGTYGNCKVQDPSSGSDVLAKHERPDRRNGVKLSNLLSVPHIQCAKRAHGITRIPGIPVASCGSRNTNNNNNNNLFNHVII